MRDCSIVTQSDTPSSRPTCSLISAIVKSPKASLLSRVFGNGPTSTPGRTSLHGPVFLAQLLLVDLTDAGLSEFFDEKDFLRDAVLRNDTLVGEDFQMRLDLGVSKAVSAFNILDHQRHRPLAPAIVLHADYRGFGHAGALGDQIFNLQRRYPFTAGLNHVLDPISDLHVAVGREHGDVASMQIAARP